MMQPTPPNPPSPLPAAPLAAGGVAAPESVPLSNNIARLADDDSVGAERLVRAMPPWARRWSGAMVSLVLHSMLVTGFGVWAYGFKGAPTPGGEEVTIAELPLVELEDDETPELEPETESGQDSSEMELSEVAPLSITEAGQLELVDVASSLGVGGHGAVNVDMTAEAGMAAQASFMGLQASGQRFCIIADCSGSMKGGKIDHVKTEVLRTISGLSGATRFQVFFFNSRAVPYPFDGWRRPGVELAELRRWVQNEIQPKGGTEPADAFQAAFRLRPRPDVIFFMTDGKFNSKVVVEIEKLNAVGRKVPVHTITFVDRSAETMMRRIATQSGGKYRHVAGF